MGEEVYLDSVVDVVGPETLVSEPYAIKVLLRFMVSLNYFHMLTQIVGYLSS